MATKDEYKSEMKNNKQQLRCGKSKLDCFEVVLNFDSCMAPAQQTRKLWYPSNIYA